jgi:6,7-dimethyl-8-ribityllumazine synthase
MAGTPLPAEIDGLEDARVLIVEARYHAAIADLLLQGATAVLAAAKAQVAIATVPGALEIPTAVAMAAQSGRYDAFVALGCVIRGETTHYELVAGESCRALVDLAVGRRLPLGNGILTVETEAQALERADPARQDKGGFAAAAALALLGLARRFGGEG